jgi:hypothetical protein
LYLARFSYDVLPTNRRRAIDLIRQEVGGARKEGRNARLLVPLTRSNTTLGNVKTALAGTYHHVSPKHAQSYLTSYAYRFNRRFRLDSIVERLAWAAVHTARPSPTGSSSRMYETDT